MPSERPYPPERLVPYDPSWVERYRNLADELQRALGAGWLIEHVGSTSVPGLVAKPVIDLALRLPAGQHLPCRLPVLDGLGWSGMATVGNHQALFLHERGLRAAIAHVFTADQWPQAHVRLFAHWLRDHASERAEYGRLKRDLVQQGAWGAAYTDAKAAFVHDVVNRARAARGLAPVSL